MKKISMLVLMLAAAVLAGCGSIEFDANGTDEGLLYYEPQPYFQVVEANGTLTTSVVMLPGARRRLKLKSGIGASDFSIELNNGMIKSIGQKTDTKLTEFTTAFTGFLAGMKGMDVGDKAKPRIWLYRITDGKITHVMTFREGKIVEDKLE